MFRKFTNWFFRYFFVWVIEDWAYVKKNFTYWGRVRWIIMIVLFYVLNWAMWIFWEREAFLTHVIGRFLP